MQDEINAFDCPSELLHIITVIFNYSFSIRTDIFELYIGFPAGVRQVCRSPDISLIINVLLYISC